MIEIHDFINLLQKGDIWISGLIMNKHRLFLMMLPMLITPNITRTG